MPTQTPVTVTLSELEQSSISFDTLDEAFGPESLGILIVNGLPSEYAQLRKEVLSSGSYLAALPEEELDRLTSAESNYLIGWSHGKETLKTGQPDTLKGSYYINCAPFYLPSSSSTSSTSTNNNNNNYLLPTPWPPLPGFRENIERLCTLIINVAALVARQCDRYAYVHCNKISSRDENKKNDDDDDDDNDDGGGGYEDGFLERCVRESNTTKARLLHYFPPPPEEEGKWEEEEEHHDDSWCTTHVDHGCLTGLTSALYVDEFEYPTIIPPTASTGTGTGTSTTSSSSTTTKTSAAMGNSLPVLPATTPPSEKTGLYIHSRTSAVTKISIPEDSLAFQTGEALELITGGRFRAVPHFVRVGGGSGGRRIRRRRREKEGNREGEEEEGGGKRKQRNNNVARNTLAVFTQPGLDVVVDKKRGLKFGDFSDEVVARFG